MVWQIVQQLSLGYSEELLQQRTALHLLSASLERCEEEGKGEGGQERRDGMAS
jgi:Ser-tRNA(Ala) deacylase AlaX